MSKINELADILANIGEDIVMVTYRKSDRAYDSMFSVGLASLPTALSVDTFGHADTVEEALQIALAKKADKARENAIRARVRDEIEAKVREEMGA